VLAFTMKLKLIATTAESWGVVSCVFQPEEPLVWKAGQFLHYLFHPQRQRFESAMIKCEVIDHDSSATKPTTLGLGAPTNPAPILSSAKNPPEIKVPGDVARDVAMEEWRAVNTTTSPSSWTSASFSSPASGRRSASSSPNIPPSATFR